MTDVLLSPAGTVTSYTNGVGAAAANPGNANDGNAATFSDVQAGGEGGVWPVRGWEGDIGSSQSVGAFTIKNATANGPNINEVLGVAYGQGGIGSRLQYWNGSAWTDIPGSFTADDELEPRTFTYTFTSSISAQLFRVEFGGKQANNIWPGTSIYTWSIGDAAPPPAPSIRVATHMIG